MRDDKAKFDRAGALVFGVNFAGTNDHKSYAEKFNFNFPLLSDGGCKISARFGASTKSDSIKRTVVIIDRQGKIAGVKPGMPTDDEILAEIAKLPR